MTDAAFIQAVRAALDDHERYGNIDRGWDENGAMRVVGIARGDTLEMMKMMVDEFDNEGDLRSPDSGTRAGVLLAIIEIALAVGVRLERERWEGLDGQQ